MENDERWGGWYALVLGWLAITIVALTLLSQVQW